MKKSIKQRGFTLVEVMVSMALMAGIVLGSMTFFYIGSSAQFDARLHEYVLNLQEDMLEQRLAQPYLSQTPTRSGRSRWYDRQVNVYAVADDSERL